MTDEKKASLTVLGGPLAGMRCVLPAAGVVTIGSAEGSGLHLGVTGVSPLHAQIVVEGGTVSVHETGAERELFVNDSPVGETGTVLRNGDVIWLGAPGDDEAVMLQCLLPRRPIESAAVAMPEPSPEATLAAIPLPADAFSSGAAEPPPAAPAASFDLVPEQAQPPVGAPGEGGPEEFVFTDESAAASGAPPQFDVPMPDAALADAEAYGDADEGYAAAPPAERAYAQPAEGEPVYDAPAEPVYDAPAEPVYEAEAEPVYETQAEPVYETEAEPVYDALDTPTVVEGTPESSHVVMPDLIEDEETGEPIAFAPVEPEEGVVELPADSVAPLPPVPPPTPAPAPAPQTHAPVQRSRTSPDATRPPHGPQATHPPQARPPHATMPPSRRGPARKKRSSGGAKAAVGGLVTLAVLAGLGWAGWRYVWPRFSGAGATPEPVAMVEPTPQPVATPAAAAPTTPPEVAPSPAEPPSTEIAAAPAPVAPTPTVAPSATPTPRATPSASPSPRPSPSPTPRTTPPPAQARTAPPPTTPSGPSPEAMKAQAAAQALALVGQAETALAARQFDAAIEHADGALRLDAGNARASALRAEAVQRRGLARRRFVTGRTSVQTQKASTGLSGFDSGSVDVRKASDFSGRIDVEVSPASGLEAGAGWKMRVFVLNDGKKAMRIQGMTVATNVNGSGAPAAVPAVAREITPQQRALVGETSGAWKDGTTSWASDVVINANKGDSLRCRVSWQE